MDERRKHRRYAFVIRVAVTTRSGEQPGSLLNISRDGALFTASIKVAIGMPAYLRFNVPAGPAEAIGAVARVAELAGAPCFGLHFHAGNDVYVDLVDVLASMTEAARAHEMQRITDAALQLGAG